MLRRLRHSLLMPVVAIAVLLASAAAAAEIAADRVHVHEAAAGLAGGVSDDDGHGGGQPGGCAHCLHVAAGAAVAHDLAEPPALPFASASAPPRRAGGYPQGMADPPQRPPKD